MGNRLTAMQWSKIKKDFPEIAKSATKVILDFESRIFKIHYRRFKKLKNKTPDGKSGIINDTMLEIMDWCEEVLDGDFYITASSNSPLTSERRSATFYFAEDSDATLFTLTWLNSKGIVDSK